MLPIYINDNHFDFDFYVAGWRYYEGDRLINHLKRDDLVALDFDPDNPEDNKAILVSSVNGCTLGYIPAFYSGFMYEIMKKRCHYTAKIESVNPDAIPQRKVNVSVVGQLNHTINMNSVVDDHDNLQLIKT